MEYVADQKVNVEFYEGARESAYKSEMAGHPVFEAAPFVKIMIPGSQNVMIDVPVEPMHQKRFPIQWAKYKAGQGVEGVSGWRLETWPAINSAQVQTLRHMGVHTVEQLADLSDSATQSVGAGTMELRTRAKAAISAAAGNADTEKTALENQRLRDEMAELHDMIAHLSANKPEAELVGSDVEPARRGPGRPPRTA